MSNITAEEIKQIVKEDLQDVLLEKCWKDMKRKA